MQTYRSPTHAINFVVILSDELKGMFNTYLNYEAGQTEIMEREREQNQEDLKKMKKQKHKDKPEGKSWTERMEQAEKLWFFSNTFSIEFSLNKFH